MKDGNQTPLLDRLANRGITPAQANFWVDGSGQHPAPFTPITVDSLVRGDYRPDPSLVSREEYSPGLMNEARGYVRRLAETSSEG